MKYNNSLLFVSIFIATSKNEIWNDFFEIAILWILHEIVFVKENTI